MAVVNRVRIDAMGRTAADVEQALTNAGFRINRYLKLEASLDDEQVIERDIGEPSDSEFAFHGRLLLRANIADNAEQRSISSLTANEQAELEQLKAPAQEILGVAIPVRPVGPAGAASS